MPRGKRSSPSLSPDIKRRVSKNKSPVGRKRTRSSSEEYKRRSTRRPIPLKRRSPQRRTRSPSPNKRLSPKNKSSTSTSSGSSRGRSSSSSVGSSSSRSGSSSRSSSSSGSYSSSVASTPRRSERTGKRSPRKLSPQKESKGFTKRSISKERRGSPIKRGFQDTKRTEDVKERETRTVVSRFQKAEPKDNKYQPKKSEDRRKESDKARDLSPSFNKSRGTHRATESRSYENNETKKTDRPRGHSSMIHVSNISRNVHEAHIREIFGNYGKIKNIEFPLLPELNIPRGYARVEYENANDAKNALECMSQGQIDGNVVRVELVVSDRSKSRSRSYSRNHSVTNRRHEKDSNDDRFARRRETNKSRGIRGGRDSRSRSSDSFRRR